MSKRVLFLWLVSMSLIAGCSQQSTDTARSPLEPILVKFLDFAPYELVYRFDEDFISNIRGAEPHCIYARTMLHYGSQEEPDAILANVEAVLVEDGWIPWSASSVANLFVRGDEQLIEVEVDSSHEFANGWSFYFSEWPEYKEVADRFNSILTIRVEYQWPQRNGC